MKKIYTLIAFSCLTFTTFSQKEKKDSYNDTSTFIEFGAADNKAANMAKHVIKEALKASNYHEYKEFQVENDQLGFTHARHQQYFKNTKVEFGTYVSHSRNGKVESLSGDYKKIDDNFDVRPILSKDNALTAALATVNANEYMWNTEDAADYYKKTKGQFQPEGELVLIENFAGNSQEEKNQVRLAWKFDIYATAPLSRAHVYIDAKNGEHIFSNAIIHHVAVPGTLATRYSSTISATTDKVNATSYRLRDITRGGGVNTYNLAQGTRYNRATDFTDADNNWNNFNNAAKDNAALDGHTGAQATYDFFKNVLGRNSFNNSGGAINSYIHYSRSYVNAFWDGAKMTYGDGDGVSFDPLTSTDVCGHEIGHGVCTYTANLAYNKESGAMNEALSDIWGACVEYYFETQKGLTHPGTWAVGEDFDLRNIAVKGFRSMSNPKQFTDPNTYGGQYWVSQNCTPSSSNDYCGVHTNSGVLNYMFYLLTVGGTGTNDIGNAYTVVGIGIDKAAKIMYRMESNYMTSTTNYLAARTAAIAAANDLYPGNTQEVRSVTNAFYAVGVGAASPNGARIGVPVDNTIADINHDDIKISTFPNPSQDFIQLKVKGEANSKIDVTIVDEMGRVRFEKLSNLTDGENNFNIDIKKLPIGKYNLRAVKNSNSGSVVSTKSLILGN
jgi:bacillolysin